MGIDVGGIEAVVFDVDGTLVDSNYEHTLAWARAFRELGIPVPTWRHRHVGMGGDQLVEAVAELPALDRSLRYALGIRM